MCKKSILLFVVISLLSFSFSAFCEDAVPVAPPAPAPEPEFLPIFPGVGIDSEYNLMGKDFVPALQGLLSALGILLSYPGPSASLRVPVSGAETALGSPPPYTLDAASIGSINRALADCKRVSIISYASSGAPGEMMQFYVERIGLSKGWICNVKNKDIRIYSKLDGQGMFGIGGQKAMVWRIDGRVDTEAITKVLGLGVVVYLYESMLLDQGKNMLKEAQAKVDAATAKLEAATAKLDEAAKSKSGAK